MSQEQLPPPQGEFTPNRLQRRRKSREGYYRLADEVRDKTVRAIRDCQTSKRQWDEDVVGYPYIAQVAYQAHPFINRWVNAFKNLDSSLSEAWLVDTRIPISLDLTQIEQNNLYARKIKGVSLKDIEQMDAPLNTTDIQRINNVFIDQRIMSKPTDDQKTLMQAIVYFATNDFAHPQDHHSTNTGKLHENLVDYFDYYTDLISDPQLSLKDEIKLMKLIWKHRSWLPTAIATYMPARLGITPSSSTKLWEWHREFSEIGATNKFNWKVWTPTKDLPHTYRPNLLPPDLEDYIHYNKSADDEASIVLAGHYGSKTEAQDLATHEQYSSALGQFALEDFNQLRRSIFKRSDRKVLIPTPNLPFKELVVTSMYPQTLIFILKFDDGRHLTIELDKQKRIWGIPPKLAKTHPHASEGLMVDILSNLPKSPIKGNSAEVRKTAFRPVVITFPRTTNSETSNVRPPKRKHLPRFAGHLDLGALPEIDRPKPQTRFVSYNEKRVREILGRNPGAYDVDIVLKALHDFEEGKLSIKPLRSQREADLYTSRRSKFRIITQHTGNQNFRLVDIDRRDDAYDPYDRNSGKLS